MGAAAAEANRTLFVGNLDSRVTEELIFELFHQAGPVIKVKIPKDRDGKPKQFAFVNFKHEESVPYGMNLLNGIKLFGRPIKIQFRSGSSHAAQDGNSSYSQHGSANASPSSTPQSTPNSNRYDRSTDNMLATGFTSSQMMQRSFSSPDNLQRQAMNSGTWQQSQYSGKFGSQHSDQSSYSSPGQQQHSSFNQSSGSQMQRRPDGSSSQRKNRMNSHPYHTDGRHFNREQRFGDYGSDHHYRGNRDEYSYEDRSHDPGSDHYSRGNRDEYCYEDRSHDGWSHDYNRRENYRDGKWRPSRH
ncbi:RNA-binding protein 7 isoform X2 [Pelodiscus sinensis]|uniref:RNA-binding protein 7 isoform X2 n=1 Tax=Pelodiscus sinensis TaxID=13735 RepID=UPI003F6D51BB